MWEGLIGGRKSDRSAKAAFMLGGLYINLSLLHEYHWVVVS